MVYFFLKNYRFLIVPLSLLVFSCSSTGDPIGDEAQLKSLHAGIQKMAKRETCVDSAEWRFTAFGSKACGGPQSYIAYSTKIDTVLFKDKVKRYNEAMAAYNEAHGVVSDCAVVEKPAGLICRDGEPEFVY
ncbi:hypothetical protein [Arenibacter amylolyticus]|uniref:hypothetical protein n=1 Tax=Arenibacter amylolyticus TaxID=1406873 RepID=UPI000A3741C2|nr:hypothetical protein [Arenibacter amylolyticus]